MLWHLKTHSLCCGNRRHTACSLLQVHLKKRESNLADDITEKNLRELAFDTQRYSGAAIANLVNLAAMRVERDGRDMICYKDLTDVRISSGCTSLPVTSLLSLHLFV